MFTDFSDWDQFIDEISGKALKTELVEKARAEEEVPPVRQSKHRRVLVNEWQRSFGSSMD